MGEQPERWHLARLVAPIAGAVAALVLAATLAAVAISLPKAASSASKNCGVALEVRDAFRETIIRAQALSAENKTATPEQKRVAADFYGSTIRRLTAVRC